jgi:hypothetical protein
MHREAEFLWQVKNVTRPSERISLAKKMRARLRGFPKLSELEPSISLLGDLRRLGWYESFQQGPTIDGEPVPWLTYPAICWLESACVGLGAVFEYGCGNSTLWWAKRSERVIAIEHDLRWLRRIGAARRPNVHIDHTPLADYANSLAERDERFDVIVIDGGLDRNACVAPAIDHLSADGLVIFDDSHLASHAEGIRLLHSAGFRRVDFVGPRPGARFIEATSVFSRDLNNWAPVQGLPIFPWIFAADAPETLP